MENVSRYYTKNKFEEAAEKVGLGLEDYMEILSEFITSALDDTVKLQEAVAAQNFDSIGKAAHSLKGAAGNMSLYDIQEWATKLEDIGKHNSIDGMDALIVNIEQSIQGIKDVLL